LLWSYNHIKKFEKNHLQYNDTPEKSRCLEEVRKN